MEIPKTNNPRLWTILPYTGLRGNYLDSGTNDNSAINNPPNTDTVLLKGIPLEQNNTGINPNLRLITFAGDSASETVRLNGGQIQLPNASLIYNFRWKVLGSTEDVNIGFYTTNYLVNGLPTTATLVLTPKGPAIYSATDRNSYSGKFKFTDTTEIFVIVDKNVLVDLEITPEVLEFKFIPDLKLYIPYVHIIDNRAVATDELADESAQKRLFKPTKKYLNLARQMIDFIIATTVILDFSTPLQTFSVEQLVPPPERYGFPEGNPFQRAHETSGGTTFYMNTRDQPGATGEWLINFGYHIYDLTLKTKQSEEKYNNSRFRPHIAVNLTVSTSPTSRRFFGEWKVLLDSGKSRISSMDGDVTNLEIARLNQDERGDFRSLLVPYFLKENTDSFGIRIKFNRIYGSRIPDNPVAFSIQNITVTYVPITS